MCDPIDRARNGDAEFFKRVPVEQILQLRGEAEQDSVLSLSVKHNHVHCSRVILQRCPSLLYQQSGSTRYNALHHAAYRGIPAIVKLLIHGAEKKLFRALDGYGDTPMQKAVINYKLETVKLLIQADPEFEFPVTYSDETPLLAAIRLSSGKTSDDISVKIRQLLLEKQPSQCKVRIGRDGWTTLHYAACKGDLGAIRDIIQFCPESRDLVDRKGQNFLHIAVQYKHVEVVEYIVREKEIVASLFNSKNNNGYTPLDIAAKMRNRKIISWLQYGLRNVQDQTIVGYENEREKELCVPPRYLELYRKLVRHFGEIAPPEQSPSLDEFLSIVSEMHDATPVTATPEMITFWEKNVGYYTSMGLQVSWLQKHVTRFIDWLTRSNEDFSRLKDEIAAKDEEFEQKSKELDKLRDELNKLRERRDEYLPPDFEFKLFVD